MKKNDLLFFLFLFFLVGCEKDENDLPELMEYQRVSLPTVIDYPCDHTCNPFNREYYNTDGKLTAKITLSWEKRTVVSSLSFYNYIPEKILSDFLVE